MDNHCIGVTGCLHISQYKARLANMSAGPGRVCLPFSSSDLPSIQRSPET